MNVKFKDQNGNDLIVAAVSGTLRLYTNPNRSLYTGQVKMVAECDNKMDPCEKQSLGCDHIGTAPHVVNKPHIFIQDLKTQDGVYDIQVVHEAINPGDSLPEGRCVGEKAIIFCIGGFVVCEFTVDMVWAISSINDVPYNQLN